jgi:hypothetical protein
MYLNIYEAIERRHLMQVYYGGYFRVIEPHVYGRDTRGIDVLKVYQVAGADELGRHVGWRWFKVSKMDAIMVLSASFSPVRPEDGLRYKALQRIYFQVAPSRTGDGSSPPSGAFRNR